MITARRSNQSIPKESVLNIHWKDWYWSWNSNTLATWCEELTHWKRRWCWERLKAGEEGDDRWDSWMAWPTWWTWVWVGSRSWWWTGRPGVLHFMGAQRVRHDWTTELNWTELMPRETVFIIFNLQFHLVSLEYSPHFLDSKNSITQLWCQFQDKNIFNISRNGWSSYRLRKWFH